jgi:iron(III) transport system substrate-binding protein
VHGPADLYWPVYRTPAVIAFNSTAVPRDSAPRDWDDILAPRWKDQVLIRDPMASGTMRAIWGLIIYRGLKATGDTAAGMAWLRKLDGQTRAYVLSPLLLTQKLGRQEGLVTLWDLPDVLIDRQRGLPLDYVFPASGTVVIDDAIGLVRGTRHARRRSGSSMWAASDEALLLAARHVFRLPARRDLPKDRSRVDRGCRAGNERDRGGLEHAGPRRAGWMAYWDQRVRNTGKQ